MHISIVALLGSALVSVSVPVAAAQGAAAPVAAPVSGAATIDLRFTNMRAATGAIMYALFDSEESYAKDGKPVRAGMIKVANGAAVEAITGLAPGNYAIKAFHDIDGDGKMGANPFGMPTEPFAFSNNAKGNMGPAGWAEAKFAVAAGPNVQSIEIK